VSLLRVNKNLVTGVSCGFFTASKIVFVDLWLRESSWSLTGHFWKQNYSCDQLSRLQLLSLCTLCKTLSYLPTLTMAFPVSNWSEMTEMTLQNIGLGLGRKCGAGVQGPGVRVPGTGYGVPGYGVHGCGKCGVWWKTWGTVFFAKIWIFLSKMRNQNFVSLYCDEH